MVKGMHLTLMIGPVVPVPVPQMVLDAFNSVKVIATAGEGMAFDGLYSIKNVTHNIERGEFAQDFTLSRNGLLSTLPKVPA